MTEPVQFGNLYKSSTVGGLLKRAALLDTLQTHLQSILPDDLRGRVRIANIRDDRLIVFVADSGAATRLRFEQNQLLDSLQRKIPKQHKPAITRLEARVRPDSMV